MICVYCRWEINQSGSSVLDACPACWKASRIGRGTVATHIGQVIAGRLRRKDLKGQTHYEGMFGMDPVSFRFEVTAYNEVWHGGKEGLTRVQLDRLCAELEQLVRKRHAVLFDWEVKPKSEPLSDVTSRWLVSVRAAFLPLTEQLS